MNKLSNSVEPSTTSFLQNTQENNSGVLNASKIKKELLFKYKTSGKASHTFMNGGKIYIPYNDLPIIYSSLSKNKENPPLTERINAYSNLFKFFIDVDDENINIDNLIYEVENIFDKLFILTKKEK